MVVFSTILLEASGLAFKQLLAGTLQGLVFRGAWSASSGQAWLDLGLSGFGVPCFGLRLPGFQALRLQAPRGWAWAVVRLGCGRIALGHETFRAVFAMQGNRKASQWAEGRHQAGRWPLQTIPPERESDMLGACGVATMISEAIRLYALKTNCRDTYSVDRRG